MNTGYLQVLLVAAYLIGGTISIVLVAGWALKRRGPPKNHESIDKSCSREKPCPPQPYHAPNHVPEKNDNWPPAFLS